MENERRNKVLSNVLIAMGIIMSIGGIIAMICDLADLWSLSVIEAWRDLLFGVIVGGFNIWILGVLIGRKHHLNKKTVREFPFYKFFIVVGLIGHLATTFLSNTSAEDSSVGLNRLFIYLLCGCLGVGINYLTNTQKDQSTE